MQKKKFEVKNNRELIVRGYVCLPDVIEDKIPVVIMSHGFTANMYSDADIVAPLTKNNIGAVIFDFCGGSLDSRSDGSFREMSVLTEVDDLKAVIDFVKSTDLFDEIFLLGVSQGGLVTGITANEVTGIKGLIYYYPAFVMPEYARAIYLSNGSIPEQPKALGLTVGKMYFEDLVNMDAFKYAENFDGPVLILQGTADPLVPAGDSVKLKEIYKNAELILYEGQGHGFTGRYRVQCIKDVISFIKRSL